MKPEENTEVVEQEEVQEGERTDLPKGFITKEEWIAKGRDPKDWRDPKEWEKRGEEILPIVKDKLTKTEKELEKLKTDMDQVLKYTKKSEERARADEREKVIKEYEAKKKKAFDNDDIDALNSAEKERDDKLKVIDEAQKPTEQNAGNDPVFVEWKDRNAWYATDAEMQKWADTTGANIVQAEMSGGKSFKEALDEVTFLAKAKWPNKFENPNRESPPSVETEGSTTNKRGNGKSWDNIPKDDQKAYFRNKENMKLRYGMDYKKEDFVRDYFS